MEETAHGRTTATSSAGARGLMQFMPATFAAYGVDGDGDGRAVITSDADSVFSAANYLTRSGVTKGPDGVRRALFAYNHATWYVNDVLHYAHAYGGGQLRLQPMGRPPHLRVLACRSHPLSSL
jgi:membrane-bound lytic murein transglycosylase B